MDSFRGPNHRTLNSGDCDATLFGRIEEQCVRLMAGQNIEVGEVCISSTTTGLQFVVSATEEGWEIEAVHVDFRENKEDMPQTRNGNPKIGNFGYQMEFSPTTTRHTYTPDWAEVAAVLGDDYFCFDSCPATIKNLFTAVHAVVVKKDEAGNEIQEETAWALGDKLADGKGGSWAMGNDLDIECPTDEEAPDEPTYKEVCETAFATTTLLENEVDSTTFTEIMSTPRWGWSIGQIASGRSGTAQIWAGAGQNDIPNKGKHVGTLNYEYHSEGGSVSVAFEVADRAKYWMKESHLHVGYEPLARDVNNEYTIAPGQYEYNHETEGVELLKDSYTGDISLTFDGRDIYIVLHTVTCWNEEVI